MMKNSKLKFIEYMQNISRSKSFGKFVLIVKGKKMNCVKNYRLLAESIFHVAHSLSFK